MSAGLVRNWWTIALRGICGILFGLIALIMPGAVLLSLALLFAAYLLADGALGIIAAVPTARAPWALAGLLAEAFSTSPWGCSLLWGTLLILAPLASAVVLTWWLGGHAIAFGVVLLALAFRLRGHRDQAVVGTAPQGAHP